MIDFWQKLKLFIPRLSQKKRVFTHAIRSIVFIILIGVSWSLYWSLLAIFLETELANWVENERDKGINISFSAPVRTNFPSHIHLRLTTLKYVDTNLNISWETEFADLFLSPFSPGKLEVKFPKKHKFTFKTQKNARQIFVVAKEVNIHQSFYKSPQTVINIEKAEIKSQHFLTQIDSISAKIGLKSQLEISHVALPTDIRGLLGHKIQQLSLLTSLAGSKLKTLSQTGLLDWKNAGGIIEFERFFIEYGPLRLAGDGTLTLDEKLQPLGAFLLQASGINETIDAAVDSGFIDVQDVTLIKIALQILGKRPNSQKTAELEFPLTIQENKLSIGQFDLLQLPKIPWPTKVKNY